MGANSPRFVATYMAEHWMATAGRVLYVNQWHSKFDRWVWVRTRPHPTNLFTAEIRTVRVAKWHASKWPWRGVTFDSSRRWEAVNFKKHPNTARREAAICEADWLWKRLCDEADECQILWQEAAICYRELSERQRDELDDRERRLKALMQRREIQLLARNRARNRK